MSLFSFLGLGNKKIKDALFRGAIIIDVRSASEFDRGKIPGSINIPVDRIPINSERIKAMNRPVIFCCTSGDRSNKAIQLMEQKGLEEAYNGGNWHHLLKIAKKF
ncbi:MAG TPA: rhodanese-like domain-containing protein [Chitinophagaceae bacterium]|nr:rhodanese-like domain-containing protein [Chitinophagaceae bacterium]